MERRTPLYDFHLRNANKLVKGGGDFMFPFEYSSNRGEHLNTRTNVGIQDLSTMGEVDVKGPEAERLINFLAVNDVRSLMPGQMRYTTLCNQDGGIIDDVTIYKLNEQHFLVVTSSGPRKKTAKWIEDNARDFNAYATDVTAAIGLPVVQGPRSRAFLASIVSEMDIEKLGYFRFGRGVIGDTEVLISRSGYTGELGYELYAPAEETGVLWDFLLKSGEEFGVKPYGVLTMNTLRLEKAYPLYGNDINENVTPFHAGLHRWINFDKPDFVGRDALLKVNDIGVDRRWTGLTLSGDNPAKVNDKVFAVATEGSEKIETGEEIGYLTFSAYGHSVGRPLAMAYIKASYIQLGRAVAIETDQGVVPASITETPFFDPKGTRLRS